MRPEAAFVLALAQGDGRRLRRIALDRPDPRDVVELALRHLVDPLCFWMWKNAISAEGPALPAGLVSALERPLREAFIHHSLRNLSLLRDLDALNGELRARAVRGLFAKGPWLALHAYPDPGTRAVGDLDLCVREPDYRRALDALQALGYESHTALPRTGPAALVQAHYGRQLRFSVPGRRPVELHFRLVNVGPPARDEDWIWDTAREIDVHGSSVTVPGPEAMLLHLLLHANQHGFAVLRLFHDIRWALERDRRTLTSHHFAGAVRRLRCRPSVHQGLALAREMAGATVGDATLGRLRPSRARQAVFRLVWRVPRVKRLEARLRRSRVESPLLYLLEMGRWRDKPRYVLRSLLGAGGATPPAVQPETVGGEVGTFFAVRPKRREQLICRAICDEFAVYDPFEDRTTLLNPTAGAILELCDGTRTPEKLTAELALVFRGDPQRMQADIERALQDLGARGFLTAGEPA